MGKLRFARKATKGKGKRWKKGSSSTSNPDHKKYRDSAKRGYFNPQKGSGGLTQDLLAKHDAIESGRQRTISESTDGSDNRSVGAKTFNTFASGFSDCSNPSFNRLMKNWQSSSVLHKEMLAVLAAVAEVIKDKGGKETETEYFAALMLTLETVESDESKAAVVCLLGMLLKRIPSSVLKVKFSEVSKVFMGLLGQYTISDHVSMLRSLIGCLSVLLRAQESAVWSNHSTLHIYNTVLSFTTHPKPKVRKAGQHAVCSILRGSSEAISRQSSNSHHPATAATVKYCIKKIEESGGSGQATTTLHVLGLLKEIFWCFTKEEIKSVCETLLRVMLLSSPLIKCCTLNALGGLFKAKPKDMSADLIAQLVNALYDYQPSSNDNQSLIAWLSTMNYALQNLQSLNSKLCLDHTVKFFGVATNCWLSDKEDVINMVTTILKDLLSGCVAPCGEQLGQSLKTSVAGSSAQKLIQCLEGALKYQYHSVWGHVLKIIAVAFQVLGRHCSSIMEKCLLSLAELRETHHFLFTADLDKAIGTAIKTMGPEVILQAIPLKVNMSGDSFDFPRSWLIPVIRDNVQETKLQFFIQFFLPLANQLRNRVLYLEKQERKVEAKTYDILQNQIWSMLPGFCTKPTDLTESFKGIAKTMGLALNERPDLRLFILAAIRNLINKNRDDEVNQKELAKYAKNFLPILFNLYTTEPDSATENSIRLAVFETIKTYLKVTPPELCTELFNKITSRLEDEAIASSSFNKHSVIDLSRSLLSYLKADEVLRLYELSKSLFQNEDRTIQKKAYRLMEEICQNQCAGCTQVVSGKLSDLQEILVSSLHKANPSSKAPRLRCLGHIVRHLESEDEDFMSAVIPEAVLCVKESSEKTRTSAFNLLLELGRAEKKWSTEPSDGIHWFINKVIGGLLGTPHVMSATLTALARIFYEFTEHITCEVTEMLVERVCMLLTAKSREVVQSALAFMKTVFDVMSNDDLVQYLPKIMQSLTHSSEDCQRHFRFKVKILLIRLVRKFGYETISKMVPESHRKVLANIRKTEARKAKAKDRKPNDDDDDDGKHKKYGKHSEDIDDLLQDSDSDDEEVKENMDVNNSSRKMKSSAFIEEAGEEIVDFLDQKVSQKITAVRPSSKVQEKIKHGFKTAPDGRLIITDDAEEVKSTKKSEDTMDYVMEAAEFAKKGQKRKRNDDSGDEEPHEYPGDRKGIHRKDPRNCQDGAVYKAKKAAGDVKKKDKHDPYAYIPLDPQVLNKRKKAKFSKQFVNVVRGAKKGAAKGTKAKAKGKRRK